MSTLISCGTGPIIKELKKINTPTARYWIDMIRKNGIDAIDGSGNTILLVSVLSENANLVEACIKSGANVNLTPQFSNAPIIIAADNGDIKSVKLLLKAKAIPVGEGAFAYKDALAMAVGQGNIELFQVILPFYTKKMLDYTKVDNARYFDGFYGRVPTEPSKYIKLLAELDKNGYKPNTNDYFAIIDGYIHSENTDDEKIFLSIIKKHASTQELKNKFLANAKSHTVVSKMYVNSYPNDLLKTNYKRCLEVLNILYENGYFLAPKDAHNSPIQAILEMFKITNNTKEIISVIDFFMERKVDFNKPMGVNDDHATLLTHILFSVGYTLMHLQPYQVDEYQKYQDVYKYLLSKGITTRTKNDRYDEYEERILEPLLQ